ncbi:hypothetical protein Fmac_002513 [Flemingia macrophylla]|uniref:Uncharacterized protein n=1 Tax=Flemingia macrophylla TaxID=520843 RepID=A0ABD1NLT9_9FABA
MYQNQTYGLMVVLPWFFLDLISSASDLRYGGVRFVFVLRLESFRRLSFRLAYAKPLEVRLHGRSINLNKKKFYWFWGDRTGVARGLSLVWCVVFGLLLYVMPFIITYLSLHSVFRLWIRWIRQRICSDSDLIRLLASRRENIGLEKAFLKKTWNYEDSDLGLFNE